MKDLKHKINTCNSAAPLLRSFTFTPTKVSDRHARRTEGSGKRQTDRQTRHTPLHHTSMHAHANTHWGEKKHPYASKHTLNAHSMYPFPHHYRGPVVSSVVWGGGKAPAPWLEFVSVCAVPRCDLWIKPRHTSFIYEIICKVYQSLLVPCHMKERTSHMDSICS